MTVIEKLKALAESATPGPWHYRDELGHEIFGAPTEPLKARKQVLLINHSARKEDAEFVAEANPDVVLGLIAQIAERDALLERVITNVGKQLPDDVYEAIMALSASAEPGAPTPQTINGHKLNCKAVDDYKPGDCSCGAEPDSKS